MVSENEGPTSSTAATTESLYQKRTSQNKPMLGKYLPKKSPSPPPSAGQQMTLHASIKVLSGRALYLRLLFCCRDDDCMKESNHNYSVLKG